jgi:hypothetical protein
MIFSISPRRALLGKEIEDKQASSPFEIAESFIEEHNPMV